MEKREHLSQLTKDTIEQVTDGIRYARKQNYYCFSMKEKQILEQAGEILPLCAALGLENLIQEMQQALLQIADAKEAQDYILTADYYELLFLPVLYQILEVCRQWGIEVDYWEWNSRFLKERYPSLYDKLSKISLEKILEGGRYQPEDTTSGDKTLFVQCSGKKVYFHSNYNPKEEAEQLAEALYEQSHTVYHILGLGLGYLPEAFLSMDTSSRFVVYESDINMIRLMCTYRDCRKLLESKRIELRYDEEYRLFLPQVGGGHAVFHEPSLHNIQNKELFSKLYDYFMTIQSAINHRKSMQENFIGNLLYEDEPVEVLKKEIEGKEVYLIAGGPSLDNAMESLKKKSEDSVIVCVGTSVKKLKAAGISPDFMIVTDPMPWMNEQVEESAEIPLWYLSTAFYGVRNQVKKGYLILQEGYLPAEEYGNKKRFHLYATGGSVTTTALDILLFMNCRQIVCMGMDMAYTGNKSHAAGTAMVRNIGEKQNKYLIPVKGVAGNTLYAPKNLTLYRKWIEKRVSRESRTRLINVSDGAYIEGMQNITVKDWMKQSK